jgi:t-SNARE complex subunit (syntaxin)
MRRENRKLEMFGQHNKPTLKQIETYVTAGVEGAPMGAADLSAAVRCSRGARRNTISVLHIVDGYED